MHRFRMRHTEDDAVAWISFEGVLSGKGSAATPVVKHAVTCASKVCFGLSLHPC